MSLIEEALRRVQGPLLPPDQTKSAAPVTPLKEKKEATSPAHSWSPTPYPTTPPLSPASRPSRVLVGVAAVVLILTAGLVVWGVFWMRRTIGRWPHTVASVPSGPETTMPESSVSPRPRTQQNPLLSGVVEGLGEPYAVINGMIVGVGEQVGGSTVLDIRHGTVKLRRANGSETLLRVTR